jgi:hydroxymethylbilane synthase
MNGPATGRLRLATRGSPQALTQAQIVAAALGAATGLDTELVPITTTGDRDRSAPLHSIGGQGVFVKEIQQAVLDGRADVAVHSAKDLPSDTPAGLVIGAFCTRRDPADALIGATLGGLALGATVATGSVRRRAQLAAERLDLSFVELRGNIARRLDQIPDGGAIVMAVAALEVLGLTDRIAERLDPTRFVPAVGQGCVAAECRDGDTATAASLAAIDHAPTRHAVIVERAFLRELGSGCSLPVGAHCDGSSLHAFLAGEIGVVFRERIDTGADTAEAARRAAALAVRARDAVGA